MANYLTYYRGLKSPAALSVHPALPRYAIATGFSVPVCPLRTLYGWLSLGFNTWAFPPPSELQCAPAQPGTFGLDSKAICSPSRRGCDCAKGEGPPGPRSTAGTSRSDVRILCGTLPCGPRLIGTCERASHLVQSGRDLRLRRIHTEGGYRDDGTVQVIALTIAALFI